MATPPAERAFCNNTNASTATTLASGTWNAAVSSGDLIVAIVTTRTTGVTSHSLSTTNLNAWTAAMPIYTHPSSAAFKTSVWWTTASAGISSGAAGPTATFNVASAASIQCIAFSGANSTAISTPSGTSPFLILLQADNAFTQALSVAGNPVWRYASSGTVTTANVGAGAGARIDGYPSVLMMTSLILENSVTSLTMIGPLGTVATTHSTTNTTSAPRIVQQLEGSVTGTTASAATTTNPLKILRHTIITI